MWRSFYCDKPSCLLLQSQCCMVCDIILECTICLSFPRSCMMQFSTSYRSWLLTFTLKTIWMASNFLFISVSERNCSNSFAFLKLLTSSNAQYMQLLVFGLNCALISYYMGFCVLWDVILTETFVSCFI